MTATAIAAPFPYFGGKRRAAPRIWQALGDPSGYVEPFAGSAAVLLARPRFKGRRVETLNDADGWLVNTWRAIQLSPEQVARHAWGPVAEIDYHARLAWLQQRRTPDLVAWLEGDPEAHDAKAAGWWLYVLACGIGDPFSPGPWLLNRDCGYDPLTCSWTINGRRFSYQFFDTIAVAARHDLAVTVRLDEHSYPGKPNVNLRLHSIVSAGNRDGEDEALVALDEIELWPERGFADVIESTDIM